MLQHKVTPKKLTLFQRVHYSVFPGEINPSSGPIGKKPRFSSCQITWTLYNLVLSTIFWSRWSPEDHFMQTGVLHFALSKVMQKL